MNTPARKTLLVDPFWGNGAVDHEPPQGIARHWYAFKGMSGNTHPGAQLPFGKLSVCAHSGGYSTGYGNNRLNSGEPVQPLYDGKKLLGLAHLHQSGAGNMGYFYNYALTGVVRGSLCAPGLCDIANETARPGYYSATALPTGVRYEGTVSESAVYHRYTAPFEDGTVVVEFSNDGLYTDGEAVRQNPAAQLHFDAGKATLAVIDDHTVTASVELQGLTLHFCFWCSGGKAALWENHTPVSAAQLETTGAGGRSFGCSFAMDGSRATGCLTISARSAEKALADNLAARSADFDAVAARADRIWEQHLGAIDIKADAQSAGVFYSALYHSLVKPADWTGESPYYPQDDFVLDIATLWDVYKTQLPLLATLYHDITAKLVRTYALLNRTLGIMPNAFGLTKDIRVEANQARLLAGYLFCDAYYRSVPGIDYTQLFRALEQEMAAEQYRDFFEQGACARTTHTLDLAECCGNAAAIARQLGLDELAAHLAGHASGWRTAFDRETGLLRTDAEYYEGNHWNYSFRPLREMEARISEYGGRQKFTALLDRFFGYTHPDSTDTRFEGFNNETDMESPYAYTYAGRHDRLCEVVHLGTRSMFVPGEGGAPGNCDSGGLTACYLWNCIGLFPVSGQDLMLIGTPAFEECTLHLASGRDFAIRRQGNGIYVRSAMLDGQPLQLLRISASRMMAGGTLTLQMTDEPALAMKE